MALQPLAQRALGLTVLVLVLTAIIAAGLAALALAGLTMIAATTLALGVFVGVSLLVAVTLAIALAVGLIGGGVIAAVLFGIVLVGLASPPVALFTVVAFLILVQLIRTAFSSPLTTVFLVLLAVLVALPLVLLAIGIFGPGAALLAVAAFGFVALVLIYLWLLFQIHRLPLAFLDLGGLTDLPGIPFRILPDLPDAVTKLREKQAQQEQAKHSLTTVFTLGAGTPRERTADARTFLFGTGEKDSYSLHSPEQFLSLDAPAQFAMGWTTFEDVDRRSAPLLPLWTATLTDATAATAAFWPMIAKYAGAFGVVPLQRVDAALAATLRADIGARWTRVFDSMVNSGNLYVIDMRIFAGTAPPSVAQARFTPDTLTFLARDRSVTPATFTPFLIRVSNGQQTHFYEDDPLDPVMRSTWLYALQAAKTSVMVWGIWCGHVYRLHIVTTAMVMTMTQKLSGNHSIRRVLDRQSKHVIGFDIVLMLDWSFPPPTSLDTSIELLQLLNLFAAGRQFFDDEPQTQLAALGLSKDDFENPAFTASEILLPAFAGRLRAQNDGVSRLLASPINGPVVLPTAFARLGVYEGGEDVALQSALMFDLNRLIDPRLVNPTFPVTPIFQPIAFQGVSLSPETSALLAAASTGPLPPNDVVRLNRLLLQDAFPTELMPIDWNQYPVARYVLRLFDASRRYAESIVDALYLDDAVVAADVSLQKWMTAAGKPSNGNVAGLPTLTSKASLTRVVASLVYRVTAHGLARLSPVGNPALTFVANFPPCLEQSRVPDPRDPNGDAPAATPLGVSQLLAFLPRTGTIGEMISFIYGFVFANPYEPLIPRPATSLSGTFDTELNPFADLPPGCFAALQTFRADIRRFIEFFLADSNDQNLPAHMSFAPTLAQIHQWELNIET